MYTINYTIIVLIIIIILFYIHDNKDNKIFNFNEMFDSIIDYCVEFNKHSKLGFIHIFGGASIKYYINKNKINNNYLTSDIDGSIICFYNDDDNKLKLINSFVNGLKITFPCYIWKYEIRNNHLLDYSNHLELIPIFIKIYVNNYKLFELTIYNLNQNKMNNSFSSAVKQIYNINMDDYYTYLLQNHNNDNEIILKLTVSNLILEKQSLINIINTYAHLLTYKNYNILEKYIKHIDLLIKNEPDIYKINTYKLRLTRLLNKKRDPIVF